MQRWTNKPRQVRKEAAVVGFSCAVGCLATFVSIDKAMPRDWNQAYLTGDTPWDKGEAAPALVAFLSRRSILGKVLVPGCGAGHDVRLLAGQGAEVVGLDIAAAGVSQAKSYERVGNESYICGDFLDMESCDGAAFDWVVEHTCLCALHPDERAAYAAAVAKALKSGGLFFGIFYRDVPGFDGEGPPYPIDNESLSALFGREFDLLEAYTPVAGYSSRPIGSEEVRLMRRRASGSGQIAGSCC